MDDQVFITINGTSVPLQEALNAATGAIKEFVAAATTSGEQAGTGLATGAEKGVSALQMLRNALYGAGDAAESMATGVMAKLEGATVRLGGVFESLGSRVAGFTTQLWAMTGGMMVFQLMNDAIQQVKNLTEGFFELNNEMERNVYDWKYMYQSQSASTELSGWMRKASINMPFTQTDLMTAISDLSPTNLTPAGVEQFMPMLADIAASRSMHGQPLTLDMAANAVMGAYMGYTRMIKTDLKINPEELIQYGLDATGVGIGMHINNPETLLPALQAYAEAHGLTKYSTTQKDANGQPLDIGAGYDIAHNTWFGEWSSWIDRMQNFQRDTGSTMFSAMKDDLDKLNSWWDQHHDQIAQISKVLGDDMAAGVKAGTRALEGLFDGLKNSSLGQAVMEHMSSLADDLANPQTEKNIEKLGETIGKDLGDKLKHVLDLAGSIKTAFEKIGEGFAALGKGTDALHLDGWKALDDLIVGIGTNIGNVGKTLGAMAKLLADIKDGNWGNIQGDIGAIKDAIAQGFKDNWNSSVQVAGDIGLAPAGAGGTASAPGYTPPSKNTPRSKLPPAKPGYEWQKDAHGNWQQVPDTIVPSGWNGYAPGRGGGTAGTGLSDALDQAHVVATALANVSTTSPLKVQIVNPYDGLVQMLSGSSSQYQYQYGATNQTNNFYGVMPSLVQGLIGAAMRAAQEGAGRASVTPGLGGSAGNTIVGAIGGLFS